MTTILHEDDAEQHQIVQLSARYETDAYGTHISQVVGTYSEHQAVITHLSGSKKPKQFHLTATEVNELVTSWTAFRAELQAKKEAEEKRIAALVEGANKLLTGYPMTIIEQKRPSGLSSWKITIDHSTYEWYAYEPDSLEQRTREAIDWYKEHQSTLRLEGAF